MNNLDLFAGIGGFALGMERAGFKTAAFCEMEKYCQKVLKQNWPEVPIYDDVRELSASRLASDGIRIDTITGGFPCQDISAAGAMWGKRQGTDGERSGLWGEFARLIGEIKPRYVIVENVPTILTGDSGRWFGRILSDLAALRFNAEWHSIPASALGACHHRERLWIIAYPNQQGLEGCSEAGNASEEGPQRRYQFFAGCNRIQGTTWKAEPAVCRVVDGLPRRSHRIKGLGNAIVPQIAEIIGGEIMAQHNRV